MVRLGWVGSGWGLLDTVFVNLRVADTCDTFGSDARRVD